MVSTHVLRGRADARLASVLATTLATGIGLAASAAHAQETFVIHELSPFNRVEVTNPSGPVTVTGQTWRFQPSPLPTLYGTATYYGSVVAGEVKSSVVGSGEGFSAGGWAGWRDRITIDGGSRNGEHAVVTFAIDYSWVLSTSRYETNRVMAGAFVDMNFGLESPHYQYARFGETQTNGAPNLVDVLYLAADDGGLPVGGPTYDATTAFLSFDVVLGQEYSFDGGINTFVDGRYGSATADAAHTMRWAGIASVVDGSGQNLTVDVDSGSGFDYSKRFVAPVPEPQPWTLLGLGLALLVGLQSAQRRRKVERGATA